MFDIFVFNINRISMRVFGVCVIEYKEIFGFGDKIEFVVSNWIMEFSDKFFLFDNLVFW